MRLPAAEVNEIRHLPEDLLPFTFTDRPCWEIEASLAWTTAENEVTTDASVRQDLFVSRSPSTQIHGERARHRDAGAGILALSSRCGRDAARDVGRGPGAQDLEARGHSPRLRRCSSLWGSPAHQARSA
jgi:hypothetical protein